VGALYPSNHCEQVLADNHLSDIETVPPKTWKKIVAAAMKIVEEKKGAVSRPAVQAAQGSLRRQIVDADESD
jgi:hypothetical protein